MMKRQPKSKTSASRGQIALVAVLGAILIGVVVSNLPSGEAPPLAAAAPTDHTAAAAPAATPAAPGTAAATPAKNTGPFGDYADDQNWKQPALDEVVKFDPLADAAKVAGPAVPKYDAAEIDQLRNAQDAIIFMTGGQTVAQIGSKEYHVGDMVGGLEIRKISSAGIVLHEPH
jgi:hypothetical protein